MDSEYAGFVVGRPVDTRACHVVGTGCDLDGDAVHKCQLFSRAGCGIGEEGLHFGEAPGGLPAAAVLCAGAAADGDITVGNLVAVAPGFDTGPGDSLVSGPFGTAGRDVAAEEAKGRAVGEAQAGKCGHIVGAGAVEVDGNFSSGLRGCARSNPVLGKSIGHSAAKGFSIVAGDFRLGQRGVIDDNLEERAGIVETHPTVACRGGGKEIVGLFKRAVLHCGDGQGEGPVGKGGRCR